MNKRPLKILFVSSDTFPPFRVDVSVLFGKEMVSKGHQINWILQSARDCKKEYKTHWGGGKTWVGPTNNGTTMFQRFIKHMLGFLHNAKNCKLLLTQAYDCVQLKDRFFSSLVYLVVSRFAGVKYFYWLSYPFAEALLYKYKNKSARYPLVYLVRGTLSKWILYKIIMRYADHIFVQSEQMKKDIESEGIDAHKMTAIPMGFEAENFETDIKNHTISEFQEKATVVYLGTLHRVRKIDFVLRMFAKVKKEVPESQLYLVGKGDSEADIDFLKHEASRLNILDAVVFTGFMERNKALGIVKSATVCISPFYPTPILNSTSPTKLVEYMALGKSVVANDHPEQKLVLEKSGGKICVPYSENEFAKAVIYLVKHPEVNKKMGNLGRQWAYQNRTYPIIADLVESTYSKIL
jgi:glycosyltransferase involved in cell wall biosynthesis